METTSKRQKLINFSISKIDRLSSIYDLDEDQKQDLYLSAIDMIAKWSDDHIDNNYKKCYYSVHKKLDNMIKIIVNIIKDTDNDMLVMLDSNMSYDTLLHDVLNLTKRHHILDVLYDALPPREYIVVMMYFGLDGRGPRTFKQIANALHCSHSSCVVRLYKGLARLRRPVYARKLIDYIDDYEL